MKKRHILLIPLIILAIFLVSCEVEESSYYKFKVVSIGDGFSGYYIKDSGDIIAISDETFENNIGTYQKVLDNPDSIQIVVSGDSTSTSSLSIYVYEDDLQVASVTGYPTEVGDTADADLYYEFSSGSSSE